MMSSSLKFLARVVRFLRRINPFGSRPYTLTGTPEIAESPSHSIFADVPILPAIPGISELQKSPVIPEIPEILERSTLAISTAPATLSPSNPSPLQGNLFMINATKLNSVLQNFVSSVSEIQGAAIVTPDGLALSSVLAGGMDEERVAAMSAAMLSLGERISTELARGLVDRIMIEGSTGYGVLTSCGEEAVLLVLASKAAKQGILQLEIKRLAADVKLALS